MGGIACFWCDCLIMAAVTTAQGLLLAHQHPLRLRSCRVVQPLESRRNGMVDPSGGAPPAEIRKPPCDGQEGTAVHISVPCRNCIATHRQGTAKGSRVAPAKPMSCVWLGPLVTGLESG